MDVTQAVLPGSLPGRRGGSAPAHPADAVFIALLLAFIWAGLILGFVPRIYQHIVQQRPAYLWIVHVHTVIFLGWMILLTAQLVLVRTANLALHRRLGRLAYFWGPAMIIVGTATQVMVGQSRFGTHRWDPPFLAVPLADLVNFGTLLAFAIRWRSDGATHKRLMLLATSAIGNVGFARWWGTALGQWLGEGYVSRLAQDYLGGFVILAALICYDLATRGRPNRAVLMGGALILGVESFAVYLYSSPWWGALTDQLLRP